MSYADEQMRGTLLPHGCVIDTRGSIVEQHGQLAEASIEQPPCSSQHQQSVRPLESCHMCEYNQQHKMNANGSVTNDQKELGTNHHEGVHDEAGGITVKIDR